MPRDWDVSRASMVPCFIVTETPCLAQSDYEDNCYFFFTVFSHTHKHGSFLCFLKHTHSSPPVSKSPRAARPPPLGCRPKGRSTSFVLPQKRHTVAFCVTEPLQGLRLSVLYGHQKRCLSLSGFLDRSSTVAGSNGRVSPSVSSHGLV